MAFINGDRSCKLLWLKFVHLCFAYISLGAYIRHELSWIYSSVRASGVQKWLSFEDVKVVSFHFKEHSKFIRAAIYLVYMSIITQVFYWNMYLQKCYIISPTHADYKCI